MQADSFRCSRCFQHRGKISCTTQNRRERQARSYRLPQAETTRAGQSAPSKHGLRTFGKRIMLRSPLPDVRLSPVFCRSDSSTVRQLCVDYGRSGRDTSRCRSPRQRRSADGHLQTLVLRRPGSAVAWTADTRHVHELLIPSAEFRRDVAECEAHAAASSVSYRARVSRKTGARPDSRNVSTKPPEGGGSLTVPVRERPAASACAEAEDQGVPP